MFAFLKILHLLALAFGTAAALGNIYLGFAMDKTDLAAPGYTNKVRKYFRLTALVAVAIFWLTGLLMLLGRYGGWVEGTAFGLKIAFVIVLTAIVVFMNVMAGGWAKRGGPPAYVPTLSWINAVSLLAAVILAGVAFA